jgi:4-aminobutyrate aminotransferase
VCQQYGVLFILDEIQTGFGRTGQWFAHQHYGVDPDVITLAKGMGSGMPIGAMAAKASVMAKWETGAHGGTYCGNPVCAAAARATLDVVEPLIPTVNALAHRALAVLNDRLADHPYVGDIRGLGLMIGIECVTDRATRAPNPQWVKTVMAAALDSDVLVIACGGGAVIRLMPPLIITETQLLDGIERLCAVMHAHR